MAHRKTWATLPFDAWWLGMEAASVMALRGARIAAGAAAANREIARMVGEKIASAAELQMLMLTGGLGRTPEESAAKTLAHFRPKVRANKRRLSKKRR
jgi:hypothetical protein